MKGDLAGKKAVLKGLADNIEPERKILNSLNNSLTNELFQLFQKFIRHNNLDDVVISNMTNDEIELVYDDIYQLWLYAKQIINCQEVRRRAMDVIKKINNRL